MISFRYFKANINFKNVLLLLIFVYLILAAYKTNTIINISNLINNENDQVEIKDILIVIKTSVKTHKTRITNIIDTWYQFAKSQVTKIFNFKFLNKKYNKIF